MGELPSITTSTFTARSPDNTSLANRESTLANVVLVISSAFVEANYDVLGSLLRDRRRKGLHVFKDIKEELESSKKLQTWTGAGLNGNPTVGGLQNKEQKKVGVLEETFLYYSQLTWEEAPMSNYGPSHNGSMYPLNVPSTSYPFYPQPINPLPNASIYPTYVPAGLFADSTGCVTLFVRWIEDCPLTDRLKMPSHTGSYDGKRDPNNYLHIFEGAIRSIVNCEDLKEKFRSYFSQQKIFIKTHLAVHNIKQRDGESTRAFVTRYTNDTLQILGLHEDQRISGFVHGLKTRSLVEFLFTDLPTTYKGPMEKT
ncbi:hypothetical protein Tco_1412154 [Tanacetum coccineum]